MENTNKMHCPACGHSVAPGKRTKAEAPQPGHFRIEHGSEGLRIRWRWFRPGQHLLLLVLCVGWGAFLAFLLGHARGMAGFLALHLALGLGLAYTVLAGLLNRTVIEVGQGRLRVRHGPLPWRSPPELRTRQIRQLFAQERSVRGEADSTRYELCAVDREGRTVTLVRGLEAVDQALYLERELESYLGIPDLPLAGATLVR